MIKTTSNNKTEFLASIALASQNQDITLSLVLARQLYRWLKGRPGCEVLDEAGLDVDNCVFDFTKVGQKVRVSGIVHSAPPWDETPAESDKATASYIVIESLCNGGDAMGNDLVEQALKVLRAKGEPTTETNLLAWIEAL